MQAKKRYLLVSVISSFLVLCYYAAIHLRFPSEKILASDRQELPSFVAAEDSENDVSSHFLSFDSMTAYSIHGKRRLDFSKCTMESCFDLSKCNQDNLKVHVYSYDESDKMSETYRRILSVIKNSVYFTPDPKEACLFILSIDTIDRDHLSEHYVKSLHEKLHQLNELGYWNGGRNHIIFNLYSGTWPDYVEKLDFNTENAIIAKASISQTNFRHGFDISLPLVPKTHPEKGGSRGLLSAIRFPPTKNYLLVFKGKRYLHGIGSETRNSLYHLHNGKDIILLTTCKHGKRWKYMKDDRCEKDNRAYEKHDFQTLMQNSTFCLVPRGRRLGSFRFLEALESGCIPVIASNKWVLPFDEVINWNDAVIWVDERTLQQIPDILRSIPLSRIMLLQQQTQMLWEAYFSSMENIVMTSLQIVWGRIKQLNSRSTKIWNTFPGAIHMDTQFSHNIQDFPFHSASGNRSTDARREKFTAIIYCTGNYLPVSDSPLYKLIRYVSKSTFIKTVVIIWSSDRPVPHKDKWPTISVPSHIIQPINKTVSTRFYPLSLITTDAILNLNEDTLLNTEEIDFGFKVWSSFPNRIVGYVDRSHFWDENRGSWGYTSKSLNQYSMILTSSSFYHKYYNYMYTYGLNGVLHKTVDQSQNCEDILMNFLVSHVTKFPPIKLTQRKVSKNSQQSISSLDPDHFLQRQACINTFTTVFGYMPLIRSNVRFDPALYKDPVSAFRKRYKKLEVATAA